MKHVCSFCEVGELSPVVYTHTVKAGRRTVEVPGLSKMVCGHCDEESVPLEMYARNAKLVEAALATTPAAVSRALLKTLRETFELSQRDASKLFGAGEAAFAKWESGQSDMSDPAALLVQCALHVPGVMEYLARLWKVELPVQAAVRHTRHAGEYNTSFMKEADVAVVKPQGLKLVMMSSKRSPTPRTLLNPDYTSAGNLRMAA
jgi:putative zinc finger/helix-turn-helix YgiT family protein